MEIPLNAPVECTDGVCGHSAYVLINPIADQVTDLVVKEDTFPNTEYIVPVGLVADTIIDTIRLGCSKAELEKLDRFIKTKFIEERVPERYYSYTSGTYGLGANYYFPYVIPETMQVPVEEKQIPPGELAVQRGTRVQATDGYVGRVDEFVVNPENGHITHLVLREGHLWGRKDVIIPVAELAATDKTGDDTVVLKLNKRQIESLPTFPVHRRWS